MKKFIVVIQNEYLEVEVVKVEAPCRQILYNSDKSVSNLLADKMIRDTYIYIQWV